MNPRTIALPMAIACLVSCGGNVQPGTGTSSPSPSSPSAPPTGTTSPFTPTQPSDARQPTRVGDPPPSKRGSILLHVTVSNQSFDVPSVDVDLTLDGNPVVKGTFPVGTQHNWYDFEFQVAPGTHALSATGGGAFESRDFDISDERWLTIEYVNDGHSAHFYWQLDASEPGRG